MEPAELLELREDLERESLRLQRLVEGLLALQARLSISGEAVEAAALRLHSFYTGVERCLLLVSRVVNGGTPAQGEGWHRRLLERMALATATRPALLREVTQQQLQEYLRFRHLVHNLYADELRPEPIALLIDQLPPLWQELQHDLRHFQTWLEAIGQLRASHHNL